MGVLVKWQANAIIWHTTHPLCHTVLVKGFKSFEDIAYKAFRASTEEVLSKHFKDNDTLIIQIDNTSSISFKSEADYWRCISIKEIKEEDAQTLARVFGHNNCFGFYNTKAAFGNGDFLFPLAKENIYVLDANKIQKP